MSNTGDQEGLEVIKHKKDKSRGCFRWIFWQLDSYFKSQVWHSTYIDAVLKSVISYPWLTIWISWHNATTSCPLKVRKHFYLILKRYEAPSNTSKFIGWQICVPCCEKYIKLLPTPAYSFEIWRRIKLYLIVNWYEAGSNTRIFIYLIVKRYDAASNTNIMQNQIEYILMSII